MIDRAHVVDSAAVLALVHGEPGRNQVLAILPGACISSVNWSEVLQKAEQKGLDAALTAEGLDQLGLVVMPFSRADAEAAAALWASTKDLGLSLGDRSCLALAARLRLPAVTADGTWRSVGGDVSVQLIR